MNTYGVGNALLFLGLIEIAVVCWRYGAWRLMKNIKQMRDKAPFFLLKYMWYFITPALLIFAIVFACINFTPISYNDKPFPMWSNWVGFGLMMISLVPIPVFAVIKYIRYRKTNHAVGLSPLKTIQELTIPTEGWGPALTQHQESVVRIDMKRRAISAF